MYEDSELEDATEDAIDTNEHKMRRGSQNDEKGSNADCVVQIKDDAEKIKAEESISLFVVVLCVPCSPSCMKFWLTWGHAV